MTQPQKGGAHVGGQRTRLPSTRRHAVGRELNPEVELEGNAVG